MRRSHELVLTERSGRGNPSRKARRPSSGRHGAGAEGFEAEGAYPEHLEAPAEAGPGEPGGTAHRRSLAGPALTGSSPATQRGTVPRDGTRRPRTSHCRAISRHTDAPVRRCRVRYRARSTSRTTASTSSGSRPPPRPALEVPGSRSGARPSPARHRPVSTSIRRRDTPSPAAALRGRQAHRGLPGELPDHLGPADSEIPPLSSRGEDTTLCHRRVISHPESLPPRRRVQNEPDRSAGRFATPGKPEVACTRSQMPRSLVQAAAPATSQPDASSARRSPSAWWPSSPGRRQGRSSSPWPSWCVWCSSLRPSSAAQRGRRDRAVLERVRASQP